MAPLLATILSGAKPIQKRLRLLSPYIKLVSLEKSGGMDASFKYLNDVLAEKGVSYERIFKQSSTIINYHLP